MDIADELDRLDLTRQVDLHRLWEILVRPLGFSHRSIWIVPLDEHTRPMRQIIEIPELPERLSEDEIDSFYRVCGELVDDDGSLALLLTRPAPDRLDSADRALARALLAGAARAGVRVVPIHLATDHRILALAPDDLAA